MCERSCPHCGSSDHVKGGVVHGRQRYKCRHCKKTFTDAAPRGKGKAIKALAVYMYTKMNASFGMIAKLLGVSRSTIMRWIRAEGEKTPEPEIPKQNGEIIIILDEMHHFIGKKSNKLWIWRAYDPVQRRTIAWVVGGRDDATLRMLLEKIGMKDRIFFTDDWDGYHRVIPEAQLYTGKDLTYPIEESNSDVRHYLARFRRRTKVVSKCKHMVDLSLRLLHHFQIPKNCNSLLEKLQTVFSDIPRGLNAIFA
jgi:insertion element IS1 protein InsB